MSKYSVLLIVPFLGLYLLTPNQLFSFDALTNALACEINQPIRWFHPNHPLYPFMGVVWFKIERFFGYNGYAIYSLARFNSILVACALGLLFSALRKVQSWKFSFSLVSLLAVSYAVWHYAVDGRAIGTSVFFSALLLYFIVKWNEAKNLSTHQLSGLAGLSALYVLSHGIGIFHVLAVGFWLWQRTTSSRSLGLYIGCVIVFLIIPYLSIYGLMIQPESPIGFLNWVLGYAGYQGTGGVTESAFWVQHPMEIFRGLWNGWRWAFYKPLTSGGMGTMLSHGIGVVLFFFLVATLMKFKSLKKAHKRLASLTLIWAGLVLVFLAFWSPGQEGFRLHILVPLALLVTLVWGSYKQSVWVSAVCGVVLFVCNFSGPLYSAAHIQNNKPYMMLKELRSHLDEGDVVLSATSRSLPQVEVLWPYFFPEMKGGTLDGWLFAVGSRDLNPLIQRLNQQLDSEKKLFFAADLFDKQVQVDIETRRDLPSGSVQDFVNQFLERKSITLQNGLVFVQMTSKGR